MVGFDIERHEYGEHRYPAQLVLQDVLTLHGSQFRHADCIVASPPCQEFSYMAMPWKRGKQIAAALRGLPGAEFPEGYTGSRTVTQLTALFDACFRIQREANEAVRNHCTTCGFHLLSHHAWCGCHCNKFQGGTRHIPMAVENVVGAQRWVGRAAWHHGSFYLWGDVPAVMPIISRHRPKVGGFSLSDYGKPGYAPKGFNVEAAKTVDHANIRDGYSHTRHLTNQRESDAIKQHGSGPEWFDQGICKHSSRSDSRKAASALIAKIPLELSSYIARYFHP